MEKSDILVIGAGPGGYETAAHAAAHGKSVTLIERGELGGTCLNRGCIPTKCYCRSAQAMLDIADAPSLGVALPETMVQVDYPQVVARKNQVVEQLRQGVAFVLKGVNVVKGEALFTGASEVECGGETYTADQIIVATGSRPAMLPIPGAELCVNSDQMLETTELPASMVIIGGGVIGIEFASVYAAMGVKVTVVEYCKDILPPFDAEIAKRLRMALKKRGIDIVVGAAVKEVCPGFVVKYDLKGKEKEVAADLVLMAVGRAPVVPEGLASHVSISRRGFIEVGDDMKAAGRDDLYAIGDVNGRCMLAHAATAQGMVALGCDKIDLSVVPAAVFSVPECAMVGKTEEQCVAAGLETKIGKAMYRANGKALAMGEPEGLVKIIAGADGKILGCHICGAHAADLIQEIALAMANGLTVADVAFTIHGHPTLSEVVLRAAQAAL